MQLNNFEKLNDNCYISNTDCLESMKYIPDGLVNAVIVDVPYYNVVDELWDIQWKTKDEYIMFVENMVRGWNRLLCNNGSLMVFTSRQYNRDICYVLDKYFQERRIIIWSRKRNFNTSRGKSLTSGYEPIAYYSKDSYVFNNIKIKPNISRKEYVDGVLKDGVDLSDVWDDITSLPHNSKEKVNHPTQKPIKLMERCVQLITNENNIVLDNCMGSGSTGVACLNTNRVFIGIEKDKKYYEIAKQRLLDTISKNKSKLF